MDFYQIVEKRKTIRKFSSEAIEEEKLKKILKAGIAAPTHNHKREWEFIFLKDMKIRMALVELAENINDKQDMKKVEGSLSSYDVDTKNMYLEAIPLQKRMILTSPEVLIVCYKVKNPVEDCEKIYDLNNLASVWCCIENILLAMAAEDLYGVTYIPKDTNAIKRILNIPKDYEVPVIMPFGYPAKDAVRCKQREINLDDKIHINGW